MEEKLSTKERVNKHKPIEVWVSQDGSWIWEVYKKYQKPEREAKNPYARWYCRVISPFVPEGEFGDVYVSEIKGVAFKLPSDLLKKYEEIKGNYETKVERIRKGLREMI